MSAKTAKRLRRITRNIMIGMMQENDINNETLKNMQRIDAKVTVPANKTGDGSKRVIHTPESFKGIHKRVKGLIKSGEAEQLANQMEKQIKQERKSIEDKARDSFINNETT